MAKRDRQMSNDKKISRAYRHKRIRAKVSGTAERPRMALMKSNRHFYVQFVDDTRGTTLASASTVNLGKPQNKETAKEVGRRAAEAAKAKGFTQVVVDRGGFKFHGRIKALVDAAVEAGLCITTDKDRSKEET
jgi:large subunit ribosomal protein L18